MSIRNFRSYFILVIVLILFLVSPSSQENTQPILLNIGSKQKYTIPASETKLFKFIGQAPSNDTYENLYIVVKPQTKNFFKRPSVHINSTDNFSLNCYDAGQQFTDLCILDYQDISSHDEFFMNISCVLECNPQIQLYFQSAFQWKENDQLILISNDDPLTQQIILPVPSIQFTSIEIIARLANFERAQEGIVLKVSYGQPDKTNNPTLDKYTQEPISLWNNAQGMIIPSQKLKKGDQIKIFIMVPQNMEVILRNNIVQGDKYSIHLNDQIGDVIAANQQKKYQLKLNEKQSNQLGNLTLNIKLISYSGDPEVNIGYTDQFVQKQFETSLSANGAINYPITYQQRKANSFIGQIYIKVHCKTDCAYELVAEASQNSYIFLDMQTTQIQQVIGDQVINYFYQEKVSIPKYTKSLILQYTLKIQLLEGSLQLQLGRCKQLQQSYNISKCIIKNAAQMTDQKVKQRFSGLDPHVKRTSNVFQIYWKIDVIQCPIVPQVLTQSGSNVHICEYQFVTYNKDYQKKQKIVETFYALTLTTQNQLTWLKQGKIFRGHILQGKSKYFAFQVTKIDQIQQVAFYLTIIQGKALMRGSIENQFPPYDSNMTSQRNSLVFQGDNKTAIYYVAVFGTQSTDFTIIPVIKMTNSSTKSGITLQQNVLLNFTLLKNQQKAIFYINAYPKESLKLEVYSLQGNISYQLRNSQNNNRDQNLCSKAQEPCFFNAPQHKTKYILIVTGNKSQTQVFTILVGDTKDEKCIQHPMNHPIFLSLSPKSEQCIEYIIDKPNKLQLSLSVQSIKLFSNNLEAYAIIGQNKLRINERSLHLTPSMLFRFCGSPQVKLGQVMQFSGCTLKISLISKQKLELGLVLQNQQTQFILFEGIQQRITDTNVTLDQSFQKYFAANIYAKEQHLSLLIMSYTHASYNISIKVVRQSQYNMYMRDIQSLFTTYKLASKSQKMIAQFSTSKFIVIQINSQMFEKIQQAQMLLITIQGKINANQAYTKGPDSLFGQLSFDIQLTRQQSQLQIGQAKVGYVSKDYIKSYYLPQGSYLSAQVSLTSFYSDNCAIIVAGKSDTEISPSQGQSNILILNDSSFSYKIYVIGKQDCSYQIALQDLSIPVTEITSTMPIYIQSNSTKLFLYNHKSMQNFDILQRLTAGDATVYIKSVSYSQNLTSLLKLQPQRYIQNNQATKTDIYMTKNKASFCVNCYYLIAVVPNEIVKQQLIIVLDYQRIPLKQNYYIRLSIPVRSIKKLVYHSKTSFNIGLHVLSGNFSMSVKNQLLTNQLANRKSVTQTQNILVEAPKLTKQFQNKSLDEFDEVFRYQIDLASYVDSLVAISIDKNNTLKTLATGIPLQISIQSEKAGVKFTTLQNAQIKDINIHVQILSGHILEQDEYKFILQYQEYSYGKIETQLISINKVQNSFQIWSAGKIGQYHLYIVPESHANQTVKAVILLEGQKISHLRRGSQTTYSQNNTFEVYSTGNLMMIEIFQCRGKVAVTGTSNLSNLNNNAKNNIEKVSLQHWNDGGHYVVTAQQYTGLYFISVNSTNPDVAPIYLVRYHQYGLYSSNIYREFDFESNIRFIQEQDTITFIMKQVVTIKKTTLEFETVEYTLIIGKNPQLIQQVSQCSQNKAQALIHNIRIDSTNLSQSKEVSFKVNRTQIQDYLNKKNSTNLFVSTSAQLVLHQKDTQDKLPPTLYFNYETIQLTLSQKTTNIIQKNIDITEIIIYLIIPFLIGSILIFLSCRFFVRRAYSMYPMRLVEEDVVAQSQEGIHQNAQHEQIK